MKHYLLYRGGLLCGEKLDLDLRNFTGSPFRVTCGECTALLRNRVAVKTS